MHHPVKIDHCWLGVNWRRQLPLAPELPTSPRLLQCLSLSLAPLARARFRVDRRDSLRADKQTNKQTPKTIKEAENGL